MIVRRVIDARTLPRLIESTSKWPKHFRTLRFLISSALIDKIDLAEESFSFSSFSFSRAFASKEFLKV